ncbi:MAG: nucleoside recognition domain-containing protein [Myxococcota bacterium]
MNRIFVAIILIAFVTAVYNQATFVPPLDPAVEVIEPITRMTNGLFDMAKSAVMDIVLPLIGAMTFFLGLMKVGEKAGAMMVIAKVVRPIMVRLFPDVPPNHPAMSAMILNMAANALGLGNAATPFGLKAMQELDKLNPEKGTATNAMALFLAINTSAIHLFPTGVIAVRDTLGSTDPAGILPTTLFATTCAAISAIVSCKIIERFVPAPTGLVPTPTVPDPATATAATTPAVPISVGIPTESTEADAYPLWVSVAAIGGLMAVIPVTVVYGEVVGKWIVPFLVVGFIGWGWVRGVSVYEAFVEGARDGFDTAVRIIPYLVAILASIGMLRGAGAIDLFTGLVGPFTEPFGMPAEALPMALLRPLSGSGAYGVMLATMKEHGPDSYIGYLVSTLQGSTETTFYVLAVYFGSIQVTRIRHAMIPGIIADVFGALGSIVAVQVYFTYNGLWPTP